MKAGHGNVTFSSKGDIGDLDLEKTLKTEDNSSAEGHHTSETTDFEKYASLCRGDDIPTESDGKKKVSVEDFYIVRIIYCRLHAS